MGLYSSLLKYWLLMDSGVGAAIVNGCEPTEELITVTQMNLIKLVALKKQNKIKQKTYNSES